jgi:DNA-binding transcriptional MerR regulator
MANEEGFSAPQACKLVGISYRQIDYWASTGLLRPSLVDAKGSGQRRRYSYRDLVQLKVIRRLLDAGIGLVKIRRVVAFLGTQLGEDLASASLIVNSSESLLVHHDGELVDALRHGQGVFSVVALGALSAELDGAISEFGLPAPAADAAVGHRVSA